jgi:biopolymer transport protein ExbD
MPLKINKTDDSQLNMTPMIDIVFQLILFFLFSIHFKSLEYRIESSLPKDRGLKATPQIVTPIPAIKVGLFRINSDDPQKAYTKIKISGYELVLKPYVWTGKRAADSVMEDDRDLEFAKVTAKIKALLTAAPEFKGEIDTPPPFGGSVPHADVVRVLDCFLQAGVKEVNFTGAAAPLPKAEAAARGLIK